MKKGLDENRLHVIFQHALERGDSYSSDDSDAKYAFKTTESFLDKHCAASPCAEDLLNPMEPSMSYSSISAPASPVKADSSPPASPVKECIAAASSSQVFNLNMRTQQAALERVGDAFAETVRGILANTGFSPYYNMRLLAECYQRVANVTAAWPELDDVHPWIRLFRVIETSLATLEEQIDVEPLERLSALAISVMVTVVERSIVRIQSRLARLRTERDQRKRDEEAASPSSTP